MPITLFNSIDEVDQILHKIRLFVEATRVNDLNRTVNLSELNEKVRIVEDALTFLETYKTAHSDDADFDENSFKGSVSGIIAMRTKLEDFIELMENMNTEEPIQKPEPNTTLPQANAILNPDVNSILSAFLQAQQETNAKIAHALANQGQLNSPLPNDPVMTKLTEVLEALATQQPATMSSPRLQPISIPLFSGDFTEWTTFKDLFLSLVHKDTRLSKVQKMHYLTTSLNGDAKKCVENLELSEANYDTAWKSLLDRYEDSNSIVNCNIKKLMSIPNISAESAKALSQLHATANSVIRSLASMQLTGGDHWIVYILKEKMDSESQKLWARHLKGTIPTFETLNGFLIDRIRELESYTPSSSKPKQFNNQKTPHQHGNKSHILMGTDSSNSSNCNFCQSGSHKLFQCNKFKAAAPLDRLSFVRKQKLCRNCISSTHLTKECQIRSCNKCTSKHNSLLHESFEALSSSMNSGNSNNQQKVPPAKPNNQPPASDPPKDAPNNDAKPQENTNTLTAVSDDATDANPKVFLGTVIVKVLDSNGEEHLCRAVVDNGSQSNLITTALSQKLKLRKINAKFNLGGVLDQRSEGNYKNHVFISSRMGGDFHDVLCNIVPKITGPLPNWKVNPANIPIPQHLPLADPTWHVPQQIDLLLGGGLFARIEKDKSHYLGPNLPKLKYTEFGWILMGEHKPPPADDEPDFSVCNLTTLSSIESNLRKLFEMETIPRKLPLSKEQKNVEELFTRTTTRNEEGRYIVQLPFKSNLPRLADNKSNATAQFLRLEQKLDKNPELKSQYAAVFQEYLDLGFLEPVPPEELNRPCYYLPHHGVVKESSTTTKLRVVYNASSKSSSGLSLNDTLMVGPVVQPDLFTILLRFRVGTYALSCDITKMYPQFLLKESQRDYQRLIWRFKQEDELQHFRLLGVCFGVASSPYLATRCLNQLSEDEKERFRLAAKAILECFYVDDCLASFSNLEEARDTQKELISITQTAGLSLSKWNSNSEALIPPSAKETPGDKVSLPDINTKALGVKWNVSTDCFIYEFNITTPPVITKRSCFSAISSLFDPLGLVSPVIVQGKILVQELWKTKLDWDDTLPADLDKKLRNFFLSLAAGNVIQIPRCITTCSNVKSMEFHVFTDASFSAYGACVYYVTVDEQGRRFSRLFTSKSKIVPLQVTLTPQTKLTSPRLELCGAVVGAQLLHKIRESFPDCPYYCWSDSQIVLHQLHATIEKFEPYVANRLAEVQELTDISSWRHVPGTINPADILSRGSSPQILQSQELWWSGPEFLTKSQEHWPPIFTKDVNLILTDLLTDDTEDTQVVDNSEDTIDETICGLNASPLQLKSFLARCLEESSDYAELLRVIAISLRFLLRKKSPPSSHGPLLPDEIHRAEILVLKWDQKNLLAEVHEAVQSGKIATSPKFARVRGLTPFIDETGLLRVGGRLKNSQEPYMTKHPVLLANGELASLIAKTEHRRLFHAGQQLLGSSLRQKYWILSSRFVCHNVVKNCVRCSRLRPKLQSQLMGDLPEDRVTTPIPFRATGIDFAGPVFIRRGHRRTQTLTKAYICVFVCLATKAVHCEVVSDLSTRAFLACMKRFVARRGAPLHIYSDNATNFVGADRELQQLFALQESQHEIIKAATQCGIHWHFQPPRSPHHGGLWEAAIKSLKHHLRRVMGNEKFTFEELCTITAQIEGILNSRPITELSTDPNDPQALTPGHFLALHPLTELPTPSILDLPYNRLDSWQKCQHLVETLAKHWRKDYLLSLQKKTKWFSTLPNLKVGDIVVIYEDNSPPMQWPLGRITEIHSGRDGKVRVVDVHTAKGTYRRAITKLSKLPVEGLPPSSD